MVLDQNIKITETPRDAQQGLPYVIPIEKRAEYINTLLQVGFDIVDFGSFVSKIAVPQMADQDKVLQLVNKNGTRTRLMAIVGNIRGGKDAASEPKVDLLGFPYSLSETFLQKNINSTAEKALQTIDSLLDVCNEYGKELRIFLSMGFGNPYGDKWDLDEMESQIEKFIKKGVKTITLSDTIGLATPRLIGEVFNRFIDKYEGVEFGLHIHTTPDSWYAKIDAAWQAGCRSFDGVLNGIGGCPMTGYELVGNLNTLNLLAYMRDKKINSPINLDALDEAERISRAIYS